MTGAMEIVAERHYTLPEQGLIAAMLVCALRDASNPKSQRTGVANKKELNLRWAYARAWIADDSQAPFSFIWCCQWCELDPASVREALQKRGAKLMRGLTYMARHHETRAA